MQGNFGFKNYNWHKSIYFATVHCSFLHGIRHSLHYLGAQSVCPDFKRSKSVMTESRNSLTCQLFV